MLSRRSVAAHFPRHAFDKCWRDGPTRLWNWRNCSRAKHYSTQRTEPCIALRNKAEIEFVLPDRNETRHRTGIATAFLTSDRSVSEMRCTSVNSVP